MFLNRDREKREKISRKLTRTGITGCSADRSMGFVLKFLIFLASVLIFSSLWGKTVSAVLWDSTLDYSDFNRYIKIERGDEYSISRVRRSVKLLYATGKVHQVVVQKEDMGDDGVTLTFTVEPLYFIDSIDLVGNSYINDYNIKLSANVRRFSPYYENRMGRIRDEIIYLYRTEGFLDATAGIVSERTGANTVALRIDINEGDRTLFREIEVTGDLLVSERRSLEKNIRIKHAFTPYTETGSQQIREEIENYFLKKGFLDVKVREKKSSRGRGVFVVERGNRYSLSIEGNSVVGSSVIEDVINSVPAYQHDLPEIKRKLELFYKSMGYPNVEVTVEMNDIEGEKRRVLKIRISEGGRLLLKDIKLFGVKSEDAGELKELIAEVVDDKLDEENFPEIVLNRSIIGGGYRDSDGKRVRAVDRMKKTKINRPQVRYAIPDDYLAYISSYIENRYISLGYKDVKVAEMGAFTEMDSYYLYFRVEEGPRYTLSWVDINCRNSKLEARIRDKVVLKTRVPYSEKLKELYRKRVEEFLENEGYLFSRIEEETTFDGKRVMLSLRVDEVFPVTAGDIVISGTYNTDELVVRRMLRFSSGDLLSKERIRESRQLLIQTGVFETVHISFIDEETPSPSKDVVVTVKESFRGRYDYGFGISSDEGFRVMGGFEYRNLFGKAFTLRTMLKLNRKINYFMPEFFREIFENELELLERFDRAFTTSFIVPDIYFLPFPLSTQLEFLHNFETEMEVNSLSVIEKYSIYSSIYRKYGNKYYISLGMEFNKKKTDKYSRNSVTEELETHTTDVISFIPDLTGFADFRDDPFFPVKGARISFLLKEHITLDGIRTVGGGANPVSVDDRTRYTRWENTFSIYVPLIYRTNFSGEYVPRDNLIFHSQLKYGVIGFVGGNKGSATELDSDDTLKLGGSTTIRGFSLNSILPSDYDPFDGREEERRGQGRYLFLLRNEFRIKLMDKFYLVSFLDVGNLWEKFSNIGRNDLFRYGTGGGFMFVSPVGSINLQAGLNVSPRDDDTKDIHEDSWALHFFISSF